MSSSTKRSGAIELSWLSPRWSRGSRPPTGVADHTASPDSSARRRGGQRGQVAAGSDRPALHLNPALVAQFHVVASAPEPSEGEPLGAGVARHRVEPSDAVAAEAVAAGLGRVLGDGDDGEVDVGPLLDHGPAVLEGGVAGLERGVLVAPDVAVPLDVVAQLGQPPEDVLVQDARALGVVGGQVVAVGQRGPHHRHPRCVPAAAEGEVASEGHVLQERAAGRPSSGATRA